MGKKRIYELAKEINKSSKELVDKAQSLGFDVKNHMGAISDTEEKKLRQAVGVNESTGNAPKPASQPANPDEAKKPEHKKFVTQRNNPKFQNRNNPSTKQGHKQGQSQNKGNNQGQQRNQQNQNRQQGVVNKQVSQNNRSNNTAAPAAKSAPSRTENTPQKAAPVNKPVVNKKTEDQKPINNNNQKRSNQTGQSKPAQQAPQQKTQNQKTTTQKPAAQQRPATKPAPNTNKPAAKPTNNQPAAKADGNKAGNRGNDNRNKNYGQQNRQGGYQQNRNRFKKKGKKGKQQVSNKPAVPPRKFRELPEVLEYTEGMNVADIAKKIHREPAEIIKKLFMMGVMVNQNQALDKDTIELLATDYGIEAQEKVQVDIADIDKFFEPEEVVEENLVPRPPVVTIMGHVDHGKTTLLDTLRHSRVTSGEAGGITQHIGAYQIDIDGKPITFLDTPGHAAFTSMRARGASITDITILVVAADDGVMPQTVEAINHAKAAKVPIIVAVNKIDKPGANPQHVMQELSEYELIPESWGGDTIFVEISAKFGQNIDELLEMIVLVAEVEDLKADPTQRAIGTVIEARLDKGKGPVATLLVQQGTLHVGDPIVVGNTYGRVRVMTNDLGRRDKAAGPATPVEITGLNDVPQAGDRFVVFEDEKTARAAGEERAKRALMEQRASNSRVTLDNLFESLKEGELKEVNVIIKADVQGSAEALAASLKKIEVEGVRVNIVHSAVGAINESDVTLAAASNAIIIGFNVRPTPQAKQQADAETVDIRLHRIIYKAIEEIETAMKGLLDPEFEEKITGQMVVRETYKVSKVGTIAGCYVTDGFIRRDSGVRVIRDGIVIYEGVLASLKRFKDDVKEVRQGFECGAMIEKFNDLKVDDVVEAYVMEEIKND
ncbi:MULTISPECIES: translation initiation factor IF-2 [Enterococcus]|uniref:Translation initiation factor IF-2 n=1 Tax=Enterococcus dispar ATCC 51266 TaxID=1139219 RepID=S0KCY2_9ENTE|nr:translation initiation factor IF-2 [Enterococcus dispar]EOT42562.1 translation initiation factor IF-2 [Enterococcus dispar ATCC 51266]EOW84987.1 translation initiation factor IF-2 [Enterococcus dispar ATCC 51266]OJG38048.1 translation initiation factor IF-2 [Enterococcus dispar]WCG33448.1 translation initiation factor IF-2 [Enterococcus dispar]